MGTLQTEAQLSAIPRLDGEKLRRLIAAAEEGFKSEVAWLSGPAGRSQRSSRGSVSAERRAGRRPEERTSSEETEQLPAGPACD